MQGAVRAEPQSYDGGTDGAPGATNMTDNDRETYPCSAWTIAGGWGARARAGQSFLCDEHTAANVHTASGIVRTPYSVGERPFLVGETSWQGRALLWLDRYLADAVSPISQGLLTHCRPFLAVREHAL